ncbi:MAG: HipA domain-containing protein [Xanthomonadales bacterium]|nr:HipA domain-containing protein [Xanthomonadales bacterium]MBK7146555.1 HipA domain-containing protein [Xanthomonadales bacterium]
MTSERSCFIYVQLPGTLETVPAAKLTIETLPDGVAIGRFRYGDRFLGRQDSIALDPFALPLGKTSYAFTQLKGVPGAVRDAGPDAWGRRVIEHTLERGPDDLHEIDYLLSGPQDGAGHLTFGLKPEPPAPSRHYNRTQQMPALLAAMQAIEAGGVVDPQIQQFVNAGTSMGGARPKATIEYNDQLWLGKFPSKDDRFNLQRVEFATLELARRCGITVTASRLQSSGSIDILMLARFDREFTAAGYLRYGMVSGLTVLQCGDTHLDRGKWSYPLLADELRRWSDKPDVDCAEVFRRMVFNAAVTNNDDHPRNHALLRKPKGWRLSPAYDLVPAPVVSLERRDLALIVGDYGRTASCYNLLSQAARFGLSADAARDIYNHVAKEVARWRDVFAHCGVSATDAALVAPAFLPECFFFEAPIQ